MQVKKHQLELDMAKQAGFSLEKEYIKTVKRASYLLRHLIYVNGPGVF